jgi:hypothetical protein
MVILVAVAAAAAAATAATAAMRCSSLCHSSFVNGLRATFCRPEVKLQ